VTTVIDQARIDNSGVKRGPFPRGQAWWSGFVPGWATADVRADGFVVLDVAPAGHPSQTPGRASRRRQAQALDQWARRLPLVGPAVVSHEEGT
jgi:hypothetical protein